jgi:hypothetical protein
VSYAGRAPALALQDARAALEAAKLLDEALKAKIDAALNDSESEGVAVLEDRMIEAARLLVETEVRQEVEAEITADVQARLTADQTDPAADPAPTPTPTPTPIDAQPANP